MKDLDGTAIRALLVICLLWGCNNVAAKLAAPGIPLVLQAAIRSITAAVLIWLWARARGIPLFERDGTLGTAAWVGTIFAFEFVCIFAGLAHTTAGRMAVFTYLAPCFTAIGMAWLVPGARLAPRQTAGVFMGFAGVVLAFADSGGAGDHGSTLVGDVLGVLAALLWAANTLAVRLSRLARATATKVTFCQFAIAGIVLPPVSLALGETGITRVDPVIAGAMAYQGVVAFATTIAWFWMLQRYAPTKVVVFSFLAPLFGVLAGVLVLDEAVSFTFAGGALLVAAGIVLVNLRGSRM